MGVGGADSLAKAAKFVTKAEFTEVPLLNTELTEEHKRKERGARMTVRLSEPWGSLCAFLSVGWMGGRLPALGFHLP